MFNKSLRSYLFAVLLTAFSGFSAQAATVVAGDCLPSLTHFSTIAAAIAAAPAGGTVDVCPGRYPEQLLITKNLTLIGIQSGNLDAAVIVPPAGGLVSNGSDIGGGPVAAQIFVKDSIAVTISRLTVNGAGNRLSGCSAPDMIGIYYQNSGGQITENSVHSQLMLGTNRGCQLGLAIDVESNSGAPAVTISHNSVHNYNKNGITASGPGTGGGPAVTVTANNVVGLGPSSKNAQNGIQIGYGATGAATLNRIADHIYINPPCGGSSEPQCYASSGILIYASAGITASNNMIESTQLGIVAVTDSTYGTANGTVISSNQVGGIHNFDAIDLCSDNNTAESNVLDWSTRSGIHIDDGCSPSTGSGDVVKSNTINEVCAGILLGTGSGNTTAPNTFYNDTYTTLAGDSCPPAAGSTTDGESIRTKQSIRPSPFHRE